LLVKKGSEKDQRERKKSRRWSETPGQTRGLGVGGKVRLRKERKFCGRVRGKMGTRSRYLSGGLEKSAYKRKRADGRETTRRRNRGRESEKRERGYQQERSPSLKVKHLDPGSLEDQATSGKGVRWGSEFGTQGGTSSRAGQDDFRKHRGKGRFAPGKNYSTCQVRKKERKEMGR